VNYAIADKNRDAWIDNVYYDLAFVSTITQSLTLPVTQPMIATAAGLVSRIEGAGDLTPGTVVGAIELEGASGRHASVDLVVAQNTDVEGASSSLRSVSTPEGETYFYSIVTIPQPLVPTSVTIRYDAPSGALAVAGLSLIDGRTAASLSVAVTPDFSRVHDGDVKVYRNLRAMPRAYLVHQARQEQGLAAIDAMKQPGFDPQREVILESAAPALDKPTGADAVQIVTDEPENVAMDVDVTAPGILVLSDAYYPGWQATVDGQSVPILRANYYFRGLALGAGQHRVEFTFHPRSLDVGALVSLIALGVLVALLLPERKPHTAQQ